MCSSAAPPATAAELCSSPASDRGAAKAKGLSETALQSIVKVFTVHSSPNYVLPWQNKPQRESTGASRAGARVLRGCR